MKVTFKPHNSLPETSRMVHVDHVFVGVIATTVDKALRFHWHAKAYRKYSDDEKFDIGLQIENYKAIAKIKDRLRA